MKKLILLLFLLPFLAIAQVSTGNEQEFDYGIKNNSTQTISTPVYLTTQGIDGTLGKTAAATIEKTANKQNSLTVDGTGAKYPTIDAINAVRGADSGIATLDTNGKVPLTQINDVLLGSVNYKGTYNALANTPALPAATTNKGHYYIVSTAGTQFSLTLAIGDWIISNGATYGKVDNNNAVTSVAGRVGSVTLTSSDVGLENVNNTSDLNKPISTANQTALDLKENSANKQNSLAADVTNQKYPTVTAVNNGITAAATPDATPTVKGKIQLAGDLSGTAAVPTVVTVGGVTAANIASGTNLANAATDLNTVSTIVKRDASGNFTAGTITANLTGTASTVTTNANLTGDVTSVGNATTLATVATAVTKGGSSKSLTATINAKGLTTSLSDQDIQISESQVTNLVSDLNLKSPLASPTFTGTVTTPVINVSSEIASTLASFDASKNIKSLSTVTYPSLLEISYGKGVNNPIQTQLDSKQATLVSGINIKTIGGSSLLGSGDISIGGSGDMLLASTQTNSGLKTFLNGTLGLRNVANTFTSLFSNVNTAARTYTLQNRNGTLLDDTDLSTLNTAIAAKATATGTTNYLAKFTGTSSQGNSRIFDDGTYIGISTVNTPMKDITLGNQADRKIGIENSSSIIKGRDLDIEAGKAINYLENSEVTRLGTGSYSAFSISRAPNGDLYIGARNTGVLRVPLGSTSVIEYNTSGFYYYVGDFVLTYGGTEFASQDSGFTRKNGVAQSWYSSFLFPSKISNKLYVIIGGILKVTSNNGTTFTDIQTVSLKSNQMCENSFGDVFFLNGGTLWKQTSGTGLFVNTGITMLGTYITCLNNNDIISASTTKLYRLSYGGSTPVEFKTISIAGSFGGFNSDSNDRLLFSSGEFASSQPLYSLETNALGTADLDGGILSNKAGSGKGTGKSRWSVWTGQKTTSGTDMQVMTKRIEVDETGRSEFFGQIKFKVYTVATLPTGSIGETSVVSDALAPSYMMTIMGGGSVVTPVFYNGTNWVAD